jgi:hypothetical protein
MKAILKAEFPCGYKYEFEVEYGIFDIVSMNEKMPKECPLHGKNCPPTIKKK